MKRVTVKCDGPHCRQYATPLAVAERDGWLLGDTDLCPRCTIGDRCSGEVGPEECNCVLPYGHDGICKCKHTVEDPS